VTPHFSDALHADPCRGCKDIFLRSEMLPARLVLNDPSKRGWFCTTCAAKPRGAAATPPAQGPLWS
jgi:hypothetical protein